MTDFGTDRTILRERTWRTVSGIENLIEALTRRLITPRGGLWYAPDYGLDLRQFLGEAVVDGGYEIAALIEAELEGDERVLGATVRVTALDLEGLSFEALIETARGPFRLIGRADEVKGVILYADANGAAAPQI